LGTADQMVLLSVAPNPRWWLAAILEILNDDIAGTDRPENFVFDSSCLLSAASEPCRLPTCPFLCLFIVSLYSFYYLCVIMLCFVI